MNCCNFITAAERQFNERIAARELAKYRRNGPGATTRILRDSLTGLGLSNGSLIDVGTGIGSLAFELLGRGISHAVAVDASSAFLAKAREEAARLRRADVIEFIHGDFLTVAPAIASASIVALDRVICCYPDYEPLLAEAIRHAESSVALSYPKDRWWIRAANDAQNGVRRVRANAFRTFVHRPSDIERVLRAAAFTRAMRKETWVWRVEVYVRPGRSVHQ